LFRRIAIAVTLIAWTLLLWREIAPGINVTTQGFAAYYTASYAVLHGGTADLTDDTKFEAWLPRVGIEFPEVYRGNSPTLALLMIPLTIFEPAAAQTIWLFLNVVLLIACSWIAGRLCAPDDPSARWWIAAIFPLLAPVRETIHWGQVYLLLALLILIAIWALRHQNSLVAGIAVGLMILLKPYYGILALGLLVWTRKPRAILSAVLVVAVVIAISLPLLAPAWPGFIQSQLAVIDYGSASIPANQTLNSLLLHWLVYIPDWNPAPLIDLPWLAALLYWAALLSMAIVTVWSIRDPPALWIPALVLMPILAPVGEPHHYTVALYAVALAIAEVVHTIRSDQQRPKLLIFLIVASLLLLCIPWPNLRDAALWGGWRGLFAYPRLIGALLLWIASVYIAQHRQIASPVLR
jgi:hypothetical protein